MKTIGFITYVTDTFKKIKRNLVFIIQNPQFSLYLKLIIFKRWNYISFDSVQFRPIKTLRNILIKVLDRQFTKLMRHSHLFIYWCMFTIYKYCPVDPHSDVLSGYPPSLFWIIIMLRNIFLCWKLNRPHTYW